jgi:fumarate reductase flavoprotein subunit
MTTRLAIVGGGVAGWTAATRAQQLGISVTVLEKAPRGPGRGNGCYSGGIIHAAYLSPTRPPEMIYDRIMAKTGGEARPDVARAWSQNVGRALELLRGAGAEFSPRTPAEFQSHQISPWTDDDEPIEGLLANGPVRFLAMMYRAFVEAGGTFVPGTTARQLITADGRVVGVTGTGPDQQPVEVLADAVLIADGGFQGNAELVAEHITTSYCLRGSDNDVGDGLKMGLAVGAKTIHMSNFYGFVLCRDALRDKRFVRLGEIGPQPLHLINAGMVVDGDGRRIANEDLGTEEWSFVDEPLARHIARSDTPADCWVVFDDAIWETAGRAQRPDGSDIPINPSLFEFDGTLVRADTVAELAAATGLPSDALAETLAAYNAAAGDGAPIDPPRTGNPAALTQAPFCAVPLIAAITYTMGGLLINGDAQVLDRDEQPILGLYAAGGAMGGLQGGSKNGYSGGWSEASTFGMLAAEHVARHASDAAQAVAAQA